MPDAPRIQVTSSRAVVEAAARRGVDRGSLLEAHGVPEAVLADPDARLPADRVLALWDDACARTGEPDLAVLAAIELPWGAYRVIDYLCGSADTLADAIELLARTFGIVNDHVRLTVHRPDDGGGVLRIHPDTIPARYVDYALAASVFRMSFVIDGEVDPEVHLRRSPPADPSAHHRAFGPNVRFGMPSDQVRFDPALWARPSRVADPVLREILRHHADLLLDRLPTVDPLLDRVRAALERELSRGRTELRWVARALDTSPRTLQRRLAEAGHGWRDVVERTRRDVATARLLDRSLSLEEVAVLVGYADATTFHRAFVRWTGQTPGAWRRSHRAGPP